MTRKVFYIAIFACVTIHLTFGNGNNKWQPNDNLLSIQDEFYFKLALHPHYYTHEQRYISTVALAVSYYVSSCENMSNSQRVRNAIAQTKKQLDKPSEVIGEVMQSLLRILRSIIDKPINDVKVSCPPAVSQNECEDSLQRIQRRNEACCEGYMRNVKLYDDIVDLFNDKEMSQLIDEIYIAKKTTDGDALRFFSSAASGKYSRLLERMRDIYQRQIHTKYPCNALNFPAF